MAASLASLPPNSTGQRAVPFGSWVQPGSLVELSGSGGARTSMAVSILTLFQQRGEPVAWVQPTGGSLFPPDLAAAGVNLDSLVVVQVPRITCAAAAVDMARACELLLRSGAFGLVVADFAADLPPIRVDRSLARWPLSSQQRSRWTSRWAALCRQHVSSLVLLSSSPPEQPSFGALVGVRAHIGRLRVGPGRFVIDPQLLRAKGCPHGWALRSELRKGPPGLG